MAGKKVAFGAGRPSRPQHRDLPPEADNWVGGGDRMAGEALDSSAKNSSSTPEPPAEPLKRLTLDIPASLHREIKKQTADRGTKMVEEIRDLLEQKYRQT
ncbi:hypothetical protein [Rhodococcus sp. NPDC006774]|uniref:hypothetical protein n=1 Tax=Rhodococcus sp. NPDC006774 TaxID=3157186 RepID=UPI0034010333